MKEVIDRNTVPVNKLLVLLAFFFIQKLRNLLGGRGGFIERLQRITRGGEGVMETPKKDYVIF